LQAGVRTLPAAGAIALAAPLSSELVRVVGTKLTIATGLLCATAGLWLISGATVTTTYGGVVAGLALVGVGAGLVIPSATASAMGSLPRAHTGVGSATNGTFLQVGGALGVAVIGSLLSNRYQDRLTGALAPYHLPGTLLGAVRGTLGSALSAAHGVGGTIGAVIARAARAAFISGMDLGLTTAAIVALGGAAIALVTLPRRTSVGGRRGDTFATATSPRSGPKH
jgi:cyanate permease